MPPASAAANPTTLHALSAKLDQADARLNEAIAYFSSVATASALLVALLGILITIGVAVLGYFAFVVRRVEKANDQLRQLVDQNEASVKEVTSSRIALEQTFAEQIAKLRAEVVEYEQQLHDAVNERVRIVRDTVAGELCYRASDFDGALEHFQSAHEADPADEMAAYYLGRTLTNKGRISEAVSFFQALIDDNPGNIRARRGLALALRFTDPERARAAAKSVLEMIPDDAPLKPSLENDYALILRDAGQFTEALRHHRAALKLKPGDTVTQFFISVIELLSNQTERGKARLLNAASTVSIELEDREIKPLWASVIRWSAAFINGQGGSTSAEWQDLRKHIDNNYLENTIMAHVDAISTACARTAPK